MKKRSKVIVFCFLAISLIVSGCGSGQTLEPTLTPIPTLTLTLTLMPVPTSTSTQLPTPTNTSTPEPTATATSTPIPACKSDILISKDVKDWEWIKTSESDGKHTTVMEKGISVAKIVNSKGSYYLLKKESIMKSGEYLISLYVKKDELKSPLSFAIYDYSHPSSKGYYSTFFNSSFSFNEISDIEYSKLIKTFSVTKAPAMLGFTIGAQGNFTIWIKDLKICILE